MPLPSMPPLAILALEPKTQGLKEPVATHHSLDTPPATPLPTEEAPPDYVQDEEPNLTSAFASINISKGNPSFPDVARCLVHLKLLSAFHALKEDVGYTDGLFGLWDARCESVENRDETLAKMREKRWVLYVARAVERFEAWWLHVLCGQETAKRLEQSDMLLSNPHYKKFTIEGSRQLWTAESLPPLGEQMHFLARPPLTDLARRSHGVAFTYVKPPELSRRLHALWTQGSVGYWYAMDSNRCSSWTSS